MLGGLIQNFQVLNLTVFRLKFLVFLETRIFEEGINSFKTMLRPQVSGDIQILRNEQTCPAHAQGLWSGWAWKEARPGGQEVSATWWANIFQ